MKKIYISTIAAAILSTGAMAESNSIKEAFANGKASGDISVFSENVSKNGANKDSGFIMGSAGLNYETDSFNGFKVNLGFRTNHKINEKEDGDYIGSNDTISNDDDVEAAMSTANISYTNGDATFIAGRQEIDLEWMGDFHEAVVGVFNYVPNTTIVVGHTSRFMAVDPDAALGKMQDIGTNNDGANVIDVKYEGIQDTVINPYFMDAKDTFSAYGLKVTSTISNIDLTAHYAATSEDVATTKDGSIAHVEIGTTVSDISFAAGYITTDKDNGIASLSSLGDNIDPTEDIGDSVYAADADTFYANVAADISAISLSAQYTSVTHGSNNEKDSEILLTAGTSITDELSLDLLFSSASYENSTSDTDKVTVMATYSF